MVGAVEFINDNGISQVALAFFTALFTMVGGVITLIIGNRKESREAKEAAIEAKESSQKAITNTKNISNGFAGNVLGKLSQIDGKVDALSDAINRHLEWHMREENRNGNRKEGRDHQDSGNPGA